MDIQERAKLQIQQNQASEIMDFTENNNIINDLLKTIRQLEQFNRSANAEIKRLKDAISPAWVEPAADGRDLIMTQPVKEYVFKLREQLSDSDAALIMMLSHYGPDESIAKLCEYPPNHHITHARAAIAKVLAEQV